MDQKKLWDSIAPEWHEFKTPMPKTLEFVEKQKGKLLDLGSGSGRYLIKKKDLKFYLLDFSPEMIRLAKEKAKKMGIKDIEFHVGEAHTLPYEDNFFDTALYDSTLHCIIDKIKRKKSLKELFRVLKPGANARVNVWNKDSKRFKNSPKTRTVGWLDKGGREYYLYTPDELMNELKEIGFKILKIGDTFKAIPIIIQKP